MSECIFCKIAGGEIPAAKIYEDEQLIAIADIAPVAPVHLLIIPKKHFSNTLDMQQDDEQLVGHVFSVAAAIAREKGVTEGFRIVNNNNAGAGQSVFHIHFHLLGGRHLTWPPG